MVLNEGEEKGDVEGKSKGDTEKPLLEERDPDLSEHSVIVKTGETVLGTVTVGLWLLNGIYSVGPRETRLIFHNGRLTAIVSKPGLYWAPTFGREDRLISTADVSYRVPELKVVDTNGVPIMVSAILVYRICDAKKALIDINDVAKYVQAQASAALKLIVSRYSYEALKVEADTVQEQVVDWLQSKLDVAGATAVSMTLNELNYAPEIASAMLKKQQAAALIDARELVVDGACSICIAAVKKLESEGMSLEQADKVRLVTNLLTVVCGEENATPVISVSS